MRYFFFILISCYSCNQAGNDHKCNDDELFNHLLATANTPIVANSKSSDTIVNFVHSLNNSNETKALNILMAKYPIDKTIYNSFFAYSTTKDFIGSYLSYRLADYNEDLDRNSLLLILTDSYSSASNISEYKIECLDFAKRADYAYCLWQINSKDLVSRSKWLDSLISYQKMNPNSMYIQYLIANIKYAELKYEEALAGYKNLLSNNFYRYPILRKLIRHYSLNNYDSSFYYVKQLQNYYPDKCIGDGLKLPEIISDYNKFEKECEKCLTGSRQRDSAWANVYKARYLLNTKDITKSKEIIDFFFANYSGVVIDSLKIWEAKEYSDLLLRYYFLKEDHKGLVRSALTSPIFIGEKKTKNERYLIELLKKYYQEYNIGNDSSEFRSFYDSKFSHIVSLYKSK